MNNNKSKWDMQIERILKILGADSEENAGVSGQSLRKYLDHLKNNIVLPCIVTGIEDFEWEEFYVLGPGDKEEYKELKKVRPSYTDQFEIIKFYNEVDAMYGILAKVRRISDKRKFDLPLNDLETTKDSLINKELLDDYSVWFINYQ